MAEILRLQRVGAPMPPSPLSVQRELWEQLQAYHDEHRRLPASRYVFEPNEEDCDCTYSALDADKVPVQDGEYVETVLSSKAAFQKFSQSQFSAKRIFVTRTRDGRRVCESFFQRLSRLRKEFRDIVQELTAWSEREKAKDATLSPVVSSATDLLARSRKTEDNLVVLRQCADVSKSDALMWVVESDPARRGELLSVTDVVHHAEVALRFSPAQQSQQRAVQISITNPKVLRRCSAVEAAVAFVERLEKRHDALVAQSVVDMGVDTSLRERVVSLYVLAREVAADSLETGPVEYELRMLFQRLKLLEDVDARAVPTAKSVYPTLGKLRYFSHILDYCEPGRRLEHLMAECLSAKHRNALLSDYQNALNALTAQAERHETVGETLRQLCLQEVLTTRLYEAVTSSRQILSELQTAAKQHQEIFQRLSQALIHQSGSAIENNASATQQMKEMSDDK